MKPFAYYNEIDPHAAEWLRELIKDGLITDGEVDTRSIEDVVPADLAGFDRCHFFAGIGIWDYALNRVGWTGKVWTGSCPCQPFSAAGKGEGFADERHLWPAWFHLIHACTAAFGPIPAIFGEQVSSKDGLAWLDLVQVDLESIGYILGPLDIPAASVGAPHRRQRLFFVAHTVPAGWPEGWPESGNRPAAGGGEPDGMDDPSGSRLVTERQGAESETRHETRMCGPECGCSASGMAITSKFGRRGRRDGDSPGVIVSSEPSHVNGFWRNAEWIHCRDEKYRPVEPGIFPLVAGDTAGVVRGGDAGTPENENDSPEARVMRLRGYGNAIVAPLAEEFIRSYLEI